MVSPKRSNTSPDLPEAGPDITGLDETNRKILPEPQSAHAIELTEIAARPHRNSFLHWTAFILSLAALVPPVLSLLEDQRTVSINWLWADIGLTLFFIIEFFTRSGFRWNPGGYIRTRFFDFVAMVPVLVLVYYGVALLDVWIWIIFIARIARAVDRVLGDGFIRQNVLAILDGFEEEISDRVLLRLVERIQADLERGAFGKAVAESLERNKSSVLRRIQEEHPRKGLAVGLARLVGLDAALERAEEQTYDSIVDILRSSEVDTAIREALNATFSALRKELAVKSWRQNLGFRHQRLKRVSKSNTGES